MLEVLIKVTSKADRWQENEKSLQNIISFCIFFNNVTFIESSNLALCQQKEFVLNLKVVHK